MTEIQGDLLEIKEGIVFHQVNCMGRTGGLAGVLRRKWPLAFNSYIAACHLDAPNPLGVCVFGEVNGIWIGHVFGQDKPGPNTDMKAVWDGFEYAAWYISGSPTLSAAVRQAYFPYKMGCGLGGGNWNEYRDVIETHFPNAIIVRKPGYD